MLQGIANVDSAKNQKPVGGQTASRPVAAGRKQKPQRIG